MIVWFDRSFNMHVDKSAEASNNFALSKYKSGDSDVIFKGNAVVSGKVLLFTHCQVTTYADCTMGTYYYADGARRKYFFKNYMTPVENAIREHLRGTRGYSGKITLRFRVGQTTLEPFGANGYVITGANSTSSTGSAKYVVVTKDLQ